MNRQQNGCAPSCRAGVLALLGKRNTRECGKWSEVFSELFNLRNDLDTAKASQFALQREAVAASVSCPDAGTYFASKYSECHYHWSALNVVYLSVLIIF